jgi:S1-C subfamily serine protease
VRTLLPAALVLVLAGSAFAGLPAAPAAQPENPAPTLIAERSPALVSIRFILKDEEGESEEETSGAMIDGAGMVICSNMPFGGLASLRGRSAPTPTDIKVLVGDDTQGVKARFVARDTELGLAWLQIEEAPKDPYAFIDFAQGGEPKVGDRLFSVSLMGKFFDRAPMLSEGYVTAVVTKPRRLIMPSIGIVVGAGDGSLPIFDAAGKVVGLTTVVLPEREELGRDMQSAMKGFMGQMILPAKDVLDASNRAREIAKTSTPQPDPAAPAAPAPAEPAPAPDAPAPAPK